jgi:hypothetical protein
MNIIEIKNHSKKAFIANIVIMSLFAILGIISIIQYKTINNPYNNFSFIIIGKILYVLSIIIYIKIIFEFIISIIMFINEKFKKTKLYLLLIPLIILSIIYFYVFFSITFGGYGTNDYLVVGFPLILLAICIPVGQMIWINIIENKIYIIISIIMSVIISLLLFNGVFIRMLNI